MKIGRIESYFTDEGGLFVTLINNTGVPTVKGSVVSASPAFDNAFVLQTNEFDAIGIVYDHGVADGAACRVVISGKAKVLLADGTQALAGNWVICSAVDGRGDASQPVILPNNTVSEHTQHFKEIGHCIETVPSGVDQLAMCIIHFN